MNTQNYTSDDIDNICNIVEQIPPTKYIPTVEELKSHYVEDYLDEYLPYLMYLSDSISKMSKEEYDEDKDKYKSVHRYVLSMIDKALNNN